MITHQGLKLYLAEKQTHWHTVKPLAVLKAMFALQWQADHVEYRGQGFTCDLEGVHDALEAQRLHHKEWLVENLGNATINPIAGLPADV